MTDIFFLIILMIAGDRRQQGADGLFRVMRHERGVLLYKRLESVSGKGDKTRCILMEGIDDTRPQPLPAFLSFDLVLAYLLPLDMQFANSTYRTGATKAIV